MCAMIELFEAPDVRPAAGAVLPTAMIPAMTPPTRRTSAPNPVPIRARR